MRDFERILRKVFLMYQAWRFGMVARRAYRQGDIYVADEAAREFDKLCTMI